MLRRRKKKVPMRKTTNCRLRGWWEVVEFEYLLMIETKMYSWREMQNRPTNVFERNRLGITAQWEEKTIMKISAASCFSRTTFIAYLTEQFQHSAGC